MTSRFLTAILSVLIPCAFLAARAPEQKEEAKVIDGTWEFVSAELGGVKLPDEVVKTMKLIVEKDRYTVTSPGPDDKGTVKYDRTKTPAEIDIKGEDGPNKGKTFLAIYRLDGDTLTVCYDLEGKKRPTEFKTAKETRQFLAVYKRVKK